MSAVSFVSMMLTTENLRIRKSSLRARHWLLISIFAAQISLLLYQVMSLSPTADEPGHLAAGLTQFTKREFHLYEVNPPAVFLPAGALAFLSTDLKLPVIPKQSRGSSYRSEFWAGEVLFTANGNSAIQALRWARLVPCLIAILGTWIGYHLGKRISGEQGGLAFAALWGLNPLVFGYGALLNNDIPAAVAVMAILLGFMAAWQNRKPLTGIRLGCIMALCVVVKFTLLIYLPIVLIVGVWTWYRVEKLPAVRILSSVGTACLVAFVLINSAFLWVRVGEPLGSLSFYSHALSGKNLGAFETTGNRFEGHWLGRLPLPISAHLLIGIDKQKVDFEQGLRYNYLLGEWSEQGWLHYYLVGLAFRLPVGLILMFMAAMLFAIYKCLSMFLLWIRASLVGNTNGKPNVIHGSWDAETVDSMKLFWLIQTFALLGLAFVSWNSTINQHFRYCYPFLGCLIAGAVGSLSFVSFRILKSVLWLCLFVAVIESLWGCKPRSRFSTRLQGDIDMDGRSCSVVRPIMGKSTTRLVNGWSSAQATIELTW